MHEVPGIPNAVTAIDVIEYSGAWARYRLEPITGKRHQLRVQMAALGLPLLGDTLYPQVNDAPAGITPTPCNCWPASCPSPTP